MFFAAALLTYSPLLAAAWSRFDRRSTGDVNYTSIFAHGLSTGASIHYPTQVDYNTSTIQRYDLWDQPTFAITIKPATDEDVQYIVSNQFLCSNTYGVSPELVGRSGLQIITT